MDSRFRGNDGYFTLTRHSGESQGQAFTLTGAMKAGIFNLGRPSRPTGQEAAYGLSAKRPCGRSGCSSGPLV
jgi:hypothetical protein